MKGLDTGVLLSLLEGDSKALALVKRLREEEVATTEVNFLELSVLAGAHSRSRGSRRAAVGRLRRKLTVLPLDGRAGELAVSRSQGDGPGGPSPSLLGMLAAFEVNGCEELITDQDASRWGKWRFRISSVAEYQSQNRKKRY